MLRREMDYICTCGEITFYNGGKSVHTRDQLLHALKLAHRLVPSHAD